MKIFKINNTNENTSITDTLFDFVIVGFVAILFASIGKSLVNRDIENVLFGIGNLILVSTTWYAYIFYSNRIQKKMFSFIIIIWIFNVTLALFAMSIKYFFEHDTIFAMKLITWTYALNRIVIAIIYLLIIWVNKNKALTKLMLWKSLLRILTSFLLIFFMNTLSIYNFKVSFISIGIIELISNIINVKDNNLSLLPPLDYDYNKSRIVKLNSLYVGSILITSGNIFSNFIDKLEFWEILLAISIYLTIGIIIWTIYTLRIIQFSITQNAKTLIMFSTFGILIDIGTVLIGSPFLQLDKIWTLDINVLLIGISLIIISLMNFLFIANWDQNRRAKVFSYKVKEYFTYLVIILLSFIFSNYLNIVSAYAIVILILISVFINTQIQEKIANK